MATEIPGKVYNGAWSEEGSDITIAYYLLIEIYEFLRLCADILA